MAISITNSVHGKYNELGYQVFHGDKQVYFALNHIHDTHAFADPGGDEAVPLEELRRFCVTACEQEAAKRNARMAGVAYEEWRGL